MNNRPIVIIDDDEDDLELFKAAFEAMKIENQVIVFTNSGDFHDFIQKTKTQIFFILCDINMPKLNGLELRKMTFDDERLRLKCIPFIFVSTSNSSNSVMRAYSFGVQGYFIKPQSFEGMKALLTQTMNYWNLSQVPYAELPMEKG